MEKYYFVRISRLTWRCGNADCCRSTRPDSTIDTTESAPAPGWDCVGGYDVTQSDVVHRPIHSCIIMKSLLRHIRIHYYATCGVIFIKYSFIVTTNFHHKWFSLALSYVISLSSLLHAFSSLTFHFHFNIFIRIYHIKFFLS